MKKFPNAFVIIISVIILSWILTYLIPQGAYQRVTDPESGITEVINDSYRQISAEHLSAFDLLLVIPRGIAGRANIIVLILLLGGCFYVIEKTGALTQGLHKLVSLLKGQEKLALISISAIFTMAGVTIGMQEEVIALTPVLLLFGRSLGFDVFTILYMSYGSTVLGSAFSPSNPFGVLIAQKEAGLPLLSGSEVRFIVLFFAFVLWISYLIYYTKKNRVDKMEMSSTEKSIPLRSGVILSLLGVTFVVVTYGMLKHEWGFIELSASFFALGIISGLIAKFGANRTGEFYIEGFKEMVFAAMIIGLANSISLILKEGMIIDSIVYGLFGPLKELPPSISGVLMMFSHTVLHFPIPSYSGQAIMTMPVLVPLSDLIGLSRQTCVMAYQYGAIMGDMIVPTNGALMAIIAITGIPYNKWFKFAWRPTLLMLLVGAIAIIVAVATGYK